MRILSILIFCVLSLYINGQDFSSFDCPVRIDGNTLKYPFTGGFASPQLSEADFDGDGDMDLFVFDRGGFVTMRFLRERPGFSDAYVLDRSDKVEFPVIYNWALMRDFNHDGIADIFSNPTQGCSCVQLHEGYMDNGVLRYKLRPMKFEEDKPFDIIYTEIPGGGDTNIYVPFTDIPDVVDIDNDGDLDIISFEGSSGSFVYYYKNEQVERGLPQDTMLFTIEDFCFGKFKESGVNSSIFLSDDGSCASEFHDPDQIAPKHHAGSTIMAFDYDEDNDQDLLIGDLTNNNLVFLHNGGTPEDNLMTSQDPTFPSNNIIADMPVFLSSFWVDADADGLKDVVVSVNNFSSVQNVNNTWLYKNSGNPDNQFNLVQKDFLSEQTIDFGSFSYPAFADYNQDGLMDLFVASGGVYSTGRPEIRIYLFENKGSATTPEFELVDEDYIGFSAYSSTSRNPSLAFGDLDQDGDEDLLIGEEEGHLYYVENRAGEGETFSFGTPRYQYMDINVSQKSRPFIADLNQDGLNDIILGQKKTAGRDTLFGNVHFLPNIGTEGNPFFSADITQSPNIAVLGGMTTRAGLSTALAGSPAPFVYKYNGLWNFILGSESGFLKHYASDGEDLEAIFDEVDSDFGEVREGLQSAPALHDIDNDGYLEMVIGNLRGGLSFFNTDLLVDMVSADEVVIAPEEIRLFPNPSQSQIYLSRNRQSTNSLHYQIFDYNGRMVLRGKVTDNIDISGLESGVYMVRLTGDDLNMTRVISKI